MYVSTFTTLDTALSGVEAAEEELATTGENISNVDTDDYEEQTVDLVESDPVTVAGGDGSSYQLGTGVDATAVTNVSDPYLDSAWRQQNANSSSASTLETYMEQIQSELDEPSTTGISAQLETFWSDWNDLADDPTDTSAMQAVIDDGNTLATSFNTLSEALTGSDSTSIMSQAESQYSDLMAGPTGSGESGGEVYDDAYQIASLNQAIVQAQASGGSANTLIDQRNEAIDDLSSLGNVSVQDNSDGSVTVYFGGVTSTALVSDPTTTDSDSADPGNNFSTSWSAAWDDEFATADAAAAETASTTGETQSASAYATTVGGTIGALIGLVGFSSTGIASATNAATSTGTIGAVSAQLDSVADALVQEVNNPTVDDGDDDDDDGDASTVTLTTPFFETTGTTASTIAVNTALIADPSDLQVSSGDGSDNDIALDEANNSGGTADEAYDAFVQQVGDLAESADDNETTQSDLSTQITDQRDSVEGVDLSQEMSNLISEQQAYEASAKVMNAFGTVMDALMAAVSD